MQRTLLFTRKFSRMPAFCIAPHSDVICDRTEAGRGHNNVSLDATEQLLSCSATGIQLYGTQQGVNCGNHGNHHSMTCSHLPAQVCHRLPG